MYLIILDSNNVFNNTNFDSNVFNNSIDSMYLIILDNCIYT